MIFHKTLIFWYIQNKRDLPWRTTNNPYFIWLSEIMLQQTQVAQGLSYYLNFKEAFPTVFHLAKADESTVLKMWQGLGYYSRARNLHFTAKYIVNHFDGIFPSTYKDLLQLKGVGDYTASAIASICFNLPEAVVDGNVYRVLSRYFGVKTPINSTAGIKEFKLLAQQLIDSKQPGIYNQAIMDFGATLCKPQNPLCDACPFVDSCVAFGKNLVKELPVKEKKIKIKQRFFNYLVVVTDDAKSILTQRTSKGIWQGLYEFPLIEATSDITKKELVNSELFVDLFPESTQISLFNSKTIVHKLSHQHLHTQFWIVKTATLEATTVSWKDIEQFPVPILIANFLKKYLAKENN